MEKNYKVNRKTFPKTIQGISGRPICKFDKFSFVQAGAFRQNLYFSIAVKLRVLNSFV